MLKIRITGLPTDIKAGLKRLQSCFSVLSASPIYRDRNSKYVRMYVNADLKGDSCELNSKQI